MELLLLDKRMCPVCQAHDLAFVTRRFGCVFQCSQCGDASVVSIGKCMLRMRDAVLSSLKSGCAASAFACGALPLVEVSSPLAASWTATCRRVRLFALVASRQLHIDAHNITELAAFLPPWLQAQVALSPGSLRAPLGLLDALEEACNEMASQLANCADTWCVVDSVPSATRLICNDWSQRAWPPARVAECVRNIPPRLWHALHRHQRDGVVRALELKGRLLFADEMGVGKTLQATATIAALDAYPCLIVCPAGLRCLWMDVIETWIPLTPGRDASGIAIDDVHVVRSSHDMLPSGGNWQPKIVISSYHMLAALKDSLGAVRWKTVVFDESHMLRPSPLGPSCDAVYTTAACQLGRSAQHCLMLSGTPSLSAPFGLFLQCDTLRPGLLGCSRFEFAVNYCRVTFFPHMKIGECHRVDELHEMLTTHVMIRRLKGSVSGEDLPGKQRHVVRLPADRHSSSSRNEVPSSTYAATYANEWRCRKHATLEFIGALMEHVPGKVVIFAHHVELLSEIDAHLRCLWQKTKALRRGGGDGEWFHIRIDGSVAPDARPQLVSQFTDDVNCKVALVGVTACSVGISLTAASTAVFAELPPDATWLQQAEDRLHRPTQCADVNVYLVVGACSLFDARLLSAIESSMHATRAVLDTDRGEHDIVWREEGAADGVQLCVGDSQRHPDTVSVASTSSHIPYLASAGAAVNVTHDIYFRMRSSTHRIFVALRQGSDLHRATQGPDMDDASCLPPANDMRGDSLYLSMIATLSLTEAVALTNHTSRALRENEDSGVVQEALCLFVGILDRMSLIVRRRWMTQCTWCTLAELEAKLHTIPPAKSLITTSGRQARYAERWQQATTTVSVRHAGPWVVWQCPRFMTLRDDPRSDGHAGADIPGPLGWLPRQQFFVPLCIHCGSRLPRYPSGARPGAILRAASLSAVVCSGRCRREYQFVRSSQAIRRVVRQLDRAVCNSCGVDCGQLVRALQACATMSARRDVLQQLHPQLLTECPKQARLLMERPTEGNCWEADHTIAVHRGGGTASVDMIQTLCVVCHVQKTRSETAGRHTGVDALSEAIRPACRSTLDVALAALLSKPDRRDVFAPFAADASSNPLSA